MRKEDVKNAENNEIKNKCTNLKEQSNGLELFSASLVLAMSYSLLLSFGNSEVALSPSH